MTPLANDTSPEAERVQIGIWRSWTPEKRLEVAGDLTEFVRRRVEQSIRERYPNLAERDVQIHFLRRAYGEGIAARVARYLGTSVDA